MQVVNVVYRTRLNIRNLDLKHLSDVIPNSVLRVGRPTQLCVEIDKVKVLLFCGGGIRVMGKGMMTTDCICNEVLAYGNLLSVLEHFTEEVPTLEIQTMTITTQIENWKKCNFAKYIQQCGLRTSHDFETFSALRITHFNPVCVNLFSSGKLVMCGIKCMRQAQEIESAIRTSYNDIV
jgi:TATA-box binding protein (TBP) (component of TFIID and TFIIIB)